MAKAPENPREIFPAYTKDWLDLYQKKLLSIIAYGSAVRGNYLPGQSDINFLVILEPGAMTELRKAIGVVQKWRKQQVAIPLILTEAYIRSSLDSFPIEFLSIKLNHELVYGENILAGLSIEKKHIRLQLEREFKGKLIHLRRGLLASGEDRNALRILISQSLKSFFPLFEAFLYLSEKTIPNSKEELARQAAALANQDKQLFSQLIEIGEPDKKYHTEKLINFFEKYIFTIEKIAAYIDRLDR